MSTVMVLDGRCSSVLKRNKLLISSEFATSVQGALCCSLDHNMLLGSIDKPFTFDQHDRAMEPYIINLNWLFGFLTSCGYLPESNFHELNRHASKVVIWQYLTFWLKRKRHFQKARSFYEVGKDYFKNQYAPDFRFHVPSHQNESDSNAQINLFPNCDDMNIKSTVEKLNFDGFLRTINSEYFDKYICIKN